MRKRTVPKEENLNGYKEVPDLPDYKPSFTSSFLNLTKSNKNKLEKGKPTLIPFPFPSFKDSIPGIEVGSLSAIAGISGIGKSRITRALCVQNTIEFAENNGMNVHIILNSLEESSEKVISTLVSSKLDEVYNTSLNYYQINNYSADTPLSDNLMRQIEHCSKLVDEDYGDRLDIVNQPNPLEFYKYVLKYLFTIGKFYKKGKELKLKEVLNDEYDSFEYCVDTLVMVISDTVNKYQANNGKTKYESVKEFSEYFSRQRLGLVCNVTSTFTIQMSVDLARLETDYKGNKLLQKSLPSISHILTVRSIVEDLTLLLAVYDPSILGFTDYMGYHNLHKMKNGAKFRSLIVLKTREGDIAFPKNSIPLCCRFSVDKIEQLPPPSDKERLREYF